MRAPRDISLPSTVAPPSTDAPTHTGSGPLREGRAAALLTSGRPTTASSNRPEHPSQAMPRLLRRWQEEDQSAAAEDMSTSDEEEEMSLQLHDARNPDRVSGRRTESSLQRQEGLSRSQHTQAYTVTSNTALGPSALPAAFSQSASSHAPRRAWVPVSRARDVSPRHRRRETTVRVASPQRLGRSEAMTLAVESSDEAHDHAAALVNEGRDSEVEALLSHEQRVISGAMPAAGTERRASETVYADSVIVSSDDQEDDEDEDDDESYTVQSAMLRTVARDPRSMRRSLDNIQDDDSALVRRVVRRLTAETRLPRSLSAFGHVSSSAVQAACRPCSLLCAGATFTGRQTLSTHLAPVRLQGHPVRLKEQWSVCLELSGVDFEQGQVYGQMRASHVPNATVASIVTLFTGELLTTHLVTHKWHASVKTDVFYWRKLAPFRWMPEEEALDAILHPQLVSKDYLFMRIKETDFGDVKSAEAGLSISGFYWVSFRRQDGKMEGYYYDPNSAPYQRLTLRRSQEGYGCPGWSFR